MAYACGSALGSVVKRRRTLEHKAHAKAHPRACTHTRTHKVNTYCLRPQALLLKTPCAFSPLKAM